MNRPKAVDLKTLDPCTLVTPEVKTALGVRLATPGTPDPEYGAGSKACGNNYEDRTYSSAIHTLLNGGVDRLKRTVGEAELTPLQVAGYPAYLDQRETKNIGPACDIYIDAHDGQLLLVSAFAFAEPKATADGACAQATKLANAVGPVLATK
ncbi:Protein of unknown function [Lentzea albidocapillata]|uniref:DUF3558 domain-containing protein n=1 Tax=Lentzea albidocapillata TaxID=40571 RepID=A0A1W2EE06_9PSEU|nr:Protein of unknown function [Lentzea albidocapillata]